MQVLTFLTVSLILPIVSSSKCKVKCMQVCCDIPTFYAVPYDECVNIPEDVLVSWHASFHDNNTIRKTVEFVDYAECKASDDSLDSVPFCESTSDQTGLEELTEMACARVQESYYNTVVISLIYLWVQYICGPIMLLYTCAKGLKEKFTFQLVSWYMMSMVLMSFLPFLMGPLGEYISIAIRFVDISVWLWLNVIGFHIWSELRGAHSNDNIAKNRRRFACYSIYVWGITATLTSLIFLLSRVMDSNIVESSVVIVVPGINLLTFIILSLNICITRCRVFHLTTEEHFTLKLIGLILRLGLMMGIPRALFIILIPFVGINIVLFIFFTDLEPFVIFVVLLWNPKNFFNCNFVCRCWRKPEERSNATEIRMNSY